MRHNVKSLITKAIGGLLLFSTLNVGAGNKDRAGQAGADELMINPWASSSGWACANTGSVRGIEAQYINIAGLAFTEATQVAYTHTNYLAGTGISINTVGLAQRVSETGGVLGLGIMSMSLGDIPRTEVNMPEGGIGTFSPSFLNVNLSYARAFSNSIFGGVNIKAISHQIADISASGVAIDAGVQYVTGRTDNIKFGVTLKNVGAPMKFTGDGMSFRTIITETRNTMTVEQRSAAFELPALLRIGITYDIDLADAHILSLAGNFQSNSFRKDIFSVGAQYQYGDYLELRGGYNYEEGLINDDRTTVFTGPTAGLSLKVPINREENSFFTIDYSYRATNPFDGVHAFGTSIAL